jgi:hypothetical protein
VLSFASLPTFELVVNTLAYLAQHLVVLLDSADIVSGIQDAYDRPEFHRAGYAVFHTGPSATADIEGVLIHGAQGGGRSPLHSSRVLSLSVNASPSGG